MAATLLFDLDGTLCETDWAHLEAFRQIFAGYGLAMDEHIFNAHVVGRPNTEIGAHFFPHLTPAEQAAICDAKEAKYREIVGSVQPVPGALALLDWADANGVRCAVVTNAPRLNAMLCLEGAGITRRFGAIICGEELAHAKPHPLPYLTGLAALEGDGARSLAFEDSPAGMRAAIGAGLPVIGMTTNLSAEKVLACGAALAAPDFTDPSLLAFVAARTGCC